jgi:hypothetical protein
MKQQNELDKYKTFGLTLMQLMLLLGTVGLVVTFVLRYFF